MMPNPLPLQLAVKINPRNLAFISSFFQVSLLWLESRPDLSLNEDVPDSLVL